MGTRRRALIGVLVVFLIVVWLPGSYAAQPVYAPPEALKPVTLRLEKLTADKVDAAAPTTVAGRSAANGVFPYTITVIDPLALFEHSRGLGVSHCRALAVGEVVSWMEK